MKIELELPDWCDERNIYVMAGIELAAYKNFDETSFHVKSVRCNRCGECCRSLSTDGQYPLNADGDCKHLVQDGEYWICGLGVMRPLPCGEGDPIKAKWKDWQNICCIRYDGEK